LALLQTAVFVATLVMLFGLWFHEAQATVLTWGLCAFFTLHFIWCVWSWRVVTGRWLDAYTLFFASFCLFSGGQFFLETFDLNRNGILGEAFSVETTNRTILLVITAAAAYHFGGTLQCLRNSRCPHVSTRRPSEASFCLKSVSYLGLAFLAVSVPTVMYTLVNAAQYAAANGYLAIYQQDQLVGASNWQALVATFFVPGIVFTFASLHKSPRAIGICWAMVLAFQGILLFIGARGAALIACVPMVLLHHSLVKRIRAIYLVGGAVVVLAMLPLIGQTRDQSLAARFDRLDDLLTDNPFVAVISEMGRSANTIAYTLDLVPANREFDYGVGYGYAAFTVFPNLFWDLHPSTKRGTYSDWLVWTVEADSARRSVGLGFSAIAEAYANFSIIGPSIIGAILGLGLGGIVFWARTADEPFPIALEMIVLSVLLVFPRGETCAVCRPLVWFGVIPYLLVKNRGSRSQDVARHGVRSPFSKLQPCHAKEDT
jgi:oligosaccharide repeat unit polymerase